ncbi:MAG: hypothetical protein AABW46_04610 [Nanoarchaeota archaeon]
MVDLREIKGKIMNIVRIDGPVLPIQVSRRLGKDTIFAGAVLSELVKEKQVFMSSAKVGGSSLYYIKGQENKLDILYNHLPGKEKEAYELLRTKQVLKNTECEPGIRVALRSIRDFAINFEINNESYWRWHLTPEEEAKNLIKPMKIKEEINIVKIPEEIKKGFIDKGDEFLNSVNNYFKSKNIEVFENRVIRKEREIDGIVRIRSELGDLNFYFIAKNKKKINEADLSLANDKGRKNKMQVLFLTSGELSKKSQKYLEDNLKGSVIVRKLDN